ncbi:MAG: hypothetical protein IJ551_09360 [Prevotella sp.]|nr:hypothetical protein [Prevotella sp.]
MACNLKHVKATGTDCKESPAGVSNYCMVVPLFADYIASIGPNDVKPEYVITPPSGKTALEGFKIEFKGQTGQVTSEDNGDGAAWTHTGTGRVDRNEADMALISRTLSNLGGKYLVFFPTGKTVDSKIEWKVVGNEFGESTWSVAADSGQARGDDHGLTFNVSCPYQVYPEMWWYGTINDATASVGTDDDTSDMVTITEELG